jgi:hypothetical protein
MDTIKIRRKISSSQLRISELKEFIGKHVEITISESVPRTTTKGKTAAGILSNFKNNDKIEDSSSGKITYFYKNKE